LEPWIPLAYAHVAKLPKFARYRCDAVFRYTFVCENLNKRRRGFDLALIANTQPLPEVAGVLVRFDQIASFVVNADHGIVIETQEQTGDFRKP
jgi:hypothetical protein